MVILTTIAFKIHQIIIILAILYYIIFNWNNDLIKIIGVILFTILFIIICNNIITIKIGIKLFTPNTLILVEYLYEFMNKCKNIIICIYNNENNRTKRNLNIKIVELQQQLTQEKTNKNNLNIKISKSQLQNPRKKD